MEASTGLQAQSAESARTSTPDRAFIRPIPGNDVAKLPGIEVIDLSDLPAATPTGHVYHIYNEIVGDDLSRLLNEGKRAAQRRNMVQQGANLWRLQPSPVDAAK